MATNSMERQQWKIVRLNQTTGEIQDVSSGRWIPDRVLTPANHQYRDTGKVREALYKNLGAFFLYIFQRTGGFTEMKPKTAARLMYLATYLSYDGVLRNTQRTPMTKKDMMEALGLKRKTFDRFFAEAIDANLLFKTCHGYTMSAECFVRGKVARESGTRFTKVFIKSMRDLYEVTPVQLHQYLGYIFLMMPYVNVQWNVVCHNPLQERLEDVQPMTLGEFCDTIGYDRNNAKRLLDSYRHITFNWRGQQQYFCTFFYEDDIRDMRIVCNPNIFYIGKQIEKVESYGAFCVKGDKTNEQRTTIN